MRAGEFLGQTIDVVEVAVRLVLVLLFQFAFVVRLVIEVCSLNSLSFADICRSGGRWLLRCMRERNRTYILGQRFTD